MSPVQTCTGDFLWLLLSVLYKAKARVYTRAFALYCQVGWWCDLVFDQFDRFNRLIIYCDL